jgi:NADH-quinone oxidoreductase subunit N
MNALILSAVAGVIMMFSGITLKNKSSVRLLAMFLLAAIIAANILDIKDVHFFSIDWKGLIEFDRFALVFNLVAVLCTFVFFLLSARDMEEIGKDYIEIISIPLYILTGSDKRNLKSNEASLKYFLMGAFSTGLMLMGIALYYGATGTFKTEMVPAVVPENNRVLLMAGLMLLLFSMSFKVSAAPFHFWTPDVYDGAPTVFTSFMATIVKAAGFIAFMRLFSEAFGNLHPQWKLLVAIITALTLFIGNITAVFQQSVKRMLAYSSIAQAGFMMLAIYSINADAREGLILYAAAYSLATIGIFSVLIKMKDYTFEGFNGFARHQPLIAATLVVFLLSLAGIPLTAGFLSKFYMLRAAIGEGSLWLVIFAVLMAAVSVYYYFRLIQAMYFKQSEGQAVVISSRFTFTLMGIAAIIIILGLFPNLLTYWLYF